MTNSTNNSTEKNPNNFSPSPRRKRSKWWIPLVVIVSIIGLFIIGTIAFFSLIVSSFDRAPITVNSNSVLHLNLSNIPEYNGVNPFALFSNEAPKASFLDITNAIQTAKEDDRIKGIYLEFLSGTQIATPKAVELQKILDDFKESGKFIYSYIEVGEENDYFNALPADSIFIGSESFFLLNGLGITSYFPKGLFDKVGMKFEVAKCEDFKSAGEFYTETKFSDSARYQLEVLLTQKENIFLNAVKKYRNIPRDRMIKYFNDGLCTPDDIVKKNLADAVLSQLEVKHFIKHKIKSDTINSVECKNSNCPAEKQCNDDFISINKYVQSLNQTKPNEKIIDKNKNIAVIYGSGPIVSKRGGGIQNMENKMIAADEFVEYLKEAREDPSINGIILRVNSPGGSVIASETIYQEIIKTRKVKPVYASMADVAASGGYYISMACDTIFAHPSTITGSIGVIAAIRNLSGVAKKLDISIDTISTGNGDPFFLNPLLPLKEKDKKNLQENVFSTYTRFVTKAAKARNKSFDEMRAVAKGRVWNGEDAFKRGLVDVLGGLNDAIDMMKQRINVAENKKVKIYTYPNKSHNLKVMLNFVSDLQDNKVTLKNIIQNNKIFPENMNKQISYSLFLSEMTKDNTILFALPYYPEIK